MGRPFKVIVDHKLLLSLYNRMGRPKQARVDCHRMKVEAYRFDMKWDKWNRNHCDLVEDM